MSNFNKNVKIGTAYNYKEEANESTRTLQFVEIDYNPENETRDVVNAASNGKDYADFTKNDIYWDQEVITEEYLKDFNINTVPTKYSSFDYSHNIASAIIRSKYALELAEIIYDKIKVNDKNILDLIEIQSDLIKTDNPDEPFTVDSYLRIIRLMQKIIVLAYMTNSNYTDETDGFSMGIKLGSDYTTILDHLKTIYEADANIKQYFENMVFWPHSLSITLQEDGTPLSLFESILDPVTKLPTEKIQHLYNENITHPSKRTSYSILSEYLEGINYLVLLGNYTVNFLHDWHKKTYQQYTGTSGDEYNSFSAYYDNVISKILKLPNDYLLGHNNPSYNIDYRYGYFSKVYDNTIKTLFETFYKTDDPILKYDLSLTDNDKLLLYPKGTKDDPNENLINFIFGDLGSYDYENNTITIEDNLSEQQIQDQVYKLIEVSTDLKSILGNSSLLQVLFQFSEEMTNTVNFLTSALRMFISYTSEISEVRASQMYKSDAENLIPMDDYYGSYSNSFADMFYYDEQVKYEKYETNKEGE